MKNPATDPRLARTGAPAKDKRVLVLFLFGLLILAGDVFPVFHCAAPIGYGVQLQGAGQGDGREDAPAIVPLDPAHPLPAELPARYALFLHQPLPVNRADQASLELLPGVGPHLARAIIEDIRRRGPLSSAEDLQRIPGIGPGIKARLCPLLDFTP